MANAGSFKKGEKRPGQGRPPGMANKVTNDVRKAIAQIAEDKIGEVQGWLTAVAQEDPAKAMDLYLRMIEYHIPKLARSEVTGEGGGAVVFKLSKADELV